MAEGDAAEAEGTLVPLCTLVSRVEALVVSSMLQAAGIVVHTGALHHASVEVNSVALGGHRLLVPIDQHRDASDILLEVLGEDEWTFSYGLRRAILRFAALWGGLNFASAILVVLAGAPASFLLAVPLTVLQIPVNPQGRGDFYLHPASLLED